MEIKLDIPPQSVNKCWQGKRYKSREYQKYEKDLLFILPKKKLPEPPYLIKFEFGFSNKLSDWDNPVKPLQDIMQKRYGFDDKDIYQATVIKVIVKKGKEYFKVNLESLS